jgi:preprotein translocase subunit Sec61beta
MPLASRFGRSAMIARSSAAPRRWRRSERRNELTTLAGSTPMAHRRRHRRLRRYVVAEGALTFWQSLDDDRILVPFAAISAEGFFDRAGG